MTLKLPKIGLRVERAIDWRLERYLKNKQKAPNQANAPHKYASQSRTKWGETWYNGVIDENKVFYESFSGNNALCNPEAIFRYLLNTEEYSHLTHIWSLSNTETKRIFDNQYGHLDNVASVIYESTDHYNVQATAKYLINNSTFQPPFTKKPGQIYLNTWHGTPLKKMGYDIPNGPAEAKNILRNFAAADYILSPNPFTTKIMLQNAYRLQGIYEGTIIEEGYPRIDAQFADEKSKSTIKEKLREFSKDYVFDKKLAVYAPTWKGKSFHSPDDEAMVLLERILELQSKHGTNFHFFLKVHQRVYDSASKIPDIVPYLIPNHIPTNDILAVTDLLITDYSSIFFDFLASDKPIIFFTPDRDIYTSSRGLYIDEKELPGAVANSIEDVSAAILDIDVTESTTPLQLGIYENKHRLAKAKFSQKDDGNASARVVNVIFKGELANYKTLKINKTPKIKLLIFMGGMKQNGITASALNLLGNIDYDRFDVSVLLPEPTRKSDRSLYDRVDSRVRQFMRFGSFPATTEHIIDHEEYLAGNEELSEDSLYRAESVSKAEWRRIFGDVTFDHIVDFSGYAGFWSHILRSGKARSHSVWLHNSLYQDANKVIDGATPNKLALESQFRAYKFYDNLVSVSPALRDVNARDLANYAPQSKFKSASNSLDLSYLQSQAFGSGSNASFTEARVNISDACLDDAIDKLLTTFDVANIKDRVDREFRIRCLVPRDNDLCTFVAAGRLSPEKNHERLIRGFEVVYRQFNNARLVIMGEGILGDRLNALVNTLGLNEVVTLAGYVANPFEIMARADCVVLSSDYEGQPMVILEALALGTPVITVNFSTVASTISEDEGYIVQQSVSGLSGAMSLFVQRALPERNRFDPELFNVNAMNQFYSAIGV